MLSEHNISFFYVKTIIFDRLVLTTKYRYGTLKKKSSIIIYIQRTRRRPEVMAG